jgi:serine-type D-Ala-D-Ala carboxypeptidase
MLMKYCKLFFLTTFVIVLSACSSDRDKTRDNTTNQRGEVTQKHNSSSEEDIVRNSDNKHEENNQDKTISIDKNVSYNGSYYSVQGKYDKIIIANKHYPLSSDYNPGENATAKSALLDLISDMQAQGYPISNQYSGFRSYEAQANLYQNYANQDGQAAADRYSARPGYSEHQTGLAFDLIDTSGNLVEEAGASQWLLDNAYKYGFVVRYPVGKETSTGYMPESWHLRYVGKEAKEISDSGLTLEEYYHFTGGDYEK